MTILTPRVASLLGALDSDAFTDGGAVGAIQLRAIERSANRLVSKPQQAFNLVWPETTVGETGVYAMGGVAQIQWIRLLPQIPVLIAPPTATGSTPMHIYGRMLVTSGEDVEIYFANPSRPMRPNVTADVTVTGTGSFADFDVSGIPFDWSTELNVEVWIRGIASTNARMNTTTYGTPDDRSDVLGTTVYRAGDVVATAGSWFTTPLESTASYGGHWVAFYDSNGDQIGAPRVVTINLGGTNLGFSPAMSAAEIARAQDGDAFTIYKLPDFAFSQIMAITDWSGP